MIYMTSGTNPAMATGNGNGINEGHMQRLSDDYIASLMTCKPRGVHLATVQPAVIL